MSTESTPQGESPRRSRRLRVPAPVLVAGLVVVVLLAGAFSYAANRNTTGPTPAAATSSPTATTPPATPAPAAPVGGYQVKAGSGGTARAVDGRTPIGYASTCQGAVEAATNYYTALGEGLYQDRLTADGFAGFLAQINAGLDVKDVTMSALKTQFDTIRTESKAKNIPFYDAKYHPEWGAFRVQSCTQESTAEVDIAGFSTDDAVPGVSGRYAQKISLSWFKNDWRLTDAKDLATDVYDVNPPFAAAPLPAAERNAMIAQGGPGWTGYTNAPQK
jgi:hypothetical protein